MLSKHLTVLTDAGIVSARCATPASGSGLSLTDVGRAAYESPVAALREIVGSSPVG